MEIQWKRAMIAVVARQALLPFALHAQIANIFVTNAAGFQEGLPPRGSIGTIFCTGLTVEGVVSAPQVPLPTNLAGVSVTIGGVGAPLFAVADLGGYQQINFQVPLGAQIEIDPVRSTVAISQGGFQGSATVNLGFSLYPPVTVGAFFQIAGASFGIFQHGSGYSLVTMDNPATAGETIIGYATGLPTASPVVPDGQPAPTSPLSSVPQPFVDNSDVAQLGLSINSDFSVSTSNWLPYSSIVGQPPIPFMGLAPGAVGLFQIDFVIPSGLPAGTATIAIGELYCVSAGFPICGRASGWSHTAGPAVLLPVR
jgi:uncharacterized protein (TIGR03437 family)